MEEAMKRPGRNGGMMKKMDPNQRPVNYVMVESVDEFNKKLQSRRQDCCPQDTDPEHGSFPRVALDPENNPFGIFESSARLTHLSARP